MIKDVQNQKDLRNIPIQKVGVKDVEIPLRIERKTQDNTPLTEVVYAKAKMSVSLPSHYKGTHMSRFIEILNKYQQESLVSTDIKQVLCDMKKKLDAKDAYLKFNFKYFIKKQAPISRLESLMCYDCAFEGEIDEEDNYNFFLITKVPITTLCPCSKEISEYGAHNQRALLTIKVSYDNDKHIWLEDLIKMAQDCASSEIYPLLKREDEKFVTEKAYENPKFVEDVIRDIVSKLNENEIINFYEVEMEAFESIHAHNAWAYQKFQK
ncbi:MAG: GTP cyclohydrolase I FolE2 [Candidatus Gastranaerophilales bacterium]|nr:GTP cyclohydrolase I FolE2 [Candidatus Gastranaerophilales bacterium]